MLLFTKTLCHFLKIRSDFELHEILFTINPLNSITETKILSNYVQKFEKGSGFLNIV